MTKANATKKVLDDTKAILESCKRARQTSIEMRELGDFDTAEDYDNYIEELRQYCEGLLDCLTTFSGTKSYSLERDRNGDFEIVVRSKPESCRE